MTIWPEIVMKLPATSVRPLGVNPSDSSNAPHLPGRVLLENRASIDLAARLRWAIDAGELEVHYQPLIDVRDGSTVRVEALARWPGGAPHGPDVFVDAAEKTDTVTQLDLHMIALVVRQIAEWQAAGVSPLVSVNLSQRTLARPGAIETAIDIVLDAGIDPVIIQFEVTETAEADLRVVTLAIDELRTAGFRVALDDFGTRYSFLPHLLATVADELKIDRLFVKFLPADRAQRIMRSVIDLAHELGLAVVAEGVETVEQLACVRALGCDVVQGFLFSAAVDPIVAAEEFGRVRDLGSFDPTDDAVPTLLGHA